MIKFVMRFLLSLCILLSGYSPLHAAHTHQDAIGYSPIGNLILSAPAGVGTLQHGLALVIKPSSYGIDRNPIIEVAEMMEEKNNESVPFSKHTGNNHYFTSLFSLYRLDYFVRHPKNRLASYQQFLSSSSGSLYLLFRVLRL